ncbi:MAG TPA: phosphoglucomutase/phosphomannomutase family protein [bacterium]
MKIAFGTDGWRGVIAKDFTFDRVEIVAQAIANQVKKTGKGKGILIGYDTRFLSKEFAMEAARVLASNRIPVYFSNNFVPTPVVSFSVKSLALDGAIMVTASHNPFMFNGIKFKGDYGGSSLPSINMAIEREINSKNLKIKTDLSFNDGLESKIIRITFLKERYFKALQKLVDFEALRSEKKKVVVDSMYGAGIGYLDTLLAELGWEVITLRNELNPTFGGYNPEPCPPNIDPLADTVKKHNAEMGFALDGDADRIGGVDNSGDFIDSHKIFALILRYLVEEKKWKGDVAKTITVSNMIDRLSVIYGRKLHITPVGFKHICKLMLEGNILMGGEESGGIGITKHIPERDSILNALILSEMCIKKGISLKNAVSSLMDLVGFHTFKRIDLHLNSDNHGLKKFLPNFRPGSIAGINVKDTNTSDGLKFILADNSWVMARLSGTEPILRLYCESDSDERVNTILAAIKKTINKHT